MEIYRIQQPIVFTVFGASGDLAKLKIFPAIFALAEQNRFQRDFLLIGYARSEKSNKEFQEEFAKAVKDAIGNEWTDFHDGVLEKVLPRVQYVSGQYDSPEDFRKLRGHINQNCPSKDRVEVSYFSVPPNVYSSIIEQLAQIRERDVAVRLILEKPFGTDEKSAIKQARFIQRYFEDHEIYLLDHYLGKKAVRSILTMRHMNRILNILIKGKEISSIQISALETVDVGKRIGYFDQVGAVKDMFQSHLLQILAYLTMSIPIEKSARTIQNEKHSILSSLLFVPEPSSVSMGQYEGYTQAHPSTKFSKTPTFTALKLLINRESWQGVPLFFRTGKHLGRHALYAVIELKKFDFQEKHHEPNRIIFEFFPNEKVHFNLIDEDGLARLGKLQMSESIACEGDYCLPNHGVLLLDAIREDKTFYLSYQEIFTSWRLVDQILAYCKDIDIPMEQYVKGSMGPASQHELFLGFDSHWYEGI
jgi:glucose-6-phosphate 1-dehydrogenase